MTPSLCRRHFTALYGNESYKYILMCIIYTWVCSLQAFTRALHAAHKPTQGTDTIAMQHDGGWGIVADPSLSLLLFGCTLPVAQIVSGGSDSSEEPSY